MDEKPNLNVMKGIVCGFVIFFCGVFVLCIFNLFMLIFWEILFPWRSSSWFTMWLTSIYNTYLLNSFNINIIVFIFGIIIGMFLLKRIKWR